MLVRLGDLGRRLARAEDMAQEKYGLDYTIRYTIADRLFFDPLEPEQLEELGGLGITLEDLERTGLYRRFVTEGGVGAISTEQWEDDIMGLYMFIYPPGPHEVVTDDVFIKSYLFREHGIELGSDWVSRLISVGLLEDASGMERTPMFIP